MKQHASQMAIMHAQSFPMGWPEQDFVDHINNGSDDVLGVEKNGIVQAFVVMRTQIDQAEILTIVVVEAARRRGLAGALLIEAEERVKAKGANIVFLDVAQDNPAGIHLYQKHGYRRCGQRPGYYRRDKGRVTALLYQKPL